MSKHKILTGYVHRLEDGIVKTYGPGDVAPDWVTNPDLIASVDAAAPVEDDSPEPEGDGLDSLGIKELREAAAAAGIAKSGSKADIIARLRAQEPDVEDDTDHGSLIERAKSLGIDVDDNMSEVELQALIDAEG